MKRFGIICLTFLLFVKAATAITNVTLNNENYIVVTQLPQKIVLDFDIKSETAQIEIFQDFNTNQIVDRTDRRIKVYHIVDGVKSIHDQQSSWSYIPGDDNSRSGSIQTPLMFDQENAPKSNDRWIIRVSDEDNGAAQAFVDWQLPIGKTCVLGVVKDEATFAVLPNVLVQIIPENSQEEYFAVSDIHGNFRINVPEGTYQIQTMDFEQQYYMDSPISVYVRHNQKSHINLECAQYDTYFTSSLTFANGSPAAHVGVLVENKNTLETFSGVTDKNGFVQIGVKPGKFQVHAQPYYAKMFTSGDWPQGYFANISDPDFKITGGGQIHKDIVLELYPVQLTGTCYKDGKPAKNILVQAVGDESDKEKQTLYQTFTDSNGRYVLGTFRHRTCSVYAQVKSAETKPKKGYRRIKLADKNAVNHLNFEIISDETIMGLNGSIQMNDDAEIGKITVVAYNPWSTSESSQLYTQIQDDGSYHFSISEPGDWQVGVFAENFDIIPDMHYVYLNRGTRYENLDFTLFRKNEPAVLAEGRQLLTELKILSQSENPLTDSNFLEFVLPQSGMTTVHVQTTDGKEIKKIHQDIMSKGVQYFYWDGNDATGNPIAEGVYQYQITSNSQEITQTFTLMR